MITVGIASRFPAGSARGSYSGAPRPLLFPPSPRFGACGRGQRSFDSTVFDSPSPFAHLDGGCSVSRQGTLSGPRDPCIPQEEPPHIAIADLGDRRL